MAVVWPRPRSVKLKRPVYSLRLAAYPEEMFEWIYKRILQRELTPPQSSEMERYAQLGRRREPTENYRVLPLH